MSEREKVRKTAQLFTKITDYEFVVIIITGLPIILIGFFTKKDTFWWDVGLALAIIASVSSGAWIITELLYLGYRLDHKNPYNDSLWKP